MVRREPSEEFSADLSESFDSFETLFLRGSVGDAISENVNPSVAAVYRDRNKGPFDNQYDGKDIGKKTYSGKQENLLRSFGTDSELSSVYATEDKNDGSFGVPLNIPLRETTTLKYIPSYNQTG